MPDDAPAVLHHISRRLERQRMSGRQRYGVARSVEQGLEAMRTPRRTLFDLDPLANALAHNRSPAPGEIVNAIISELDSCQGGQEPQDDLLLVIRIVER